MSTGSPENIWVILGRNVNILVEETVGSFCKKHISWLKADTFHVFLKAQSDLSN